MQQSARSVAGFWILAAVLLAAMASSSVPSPIYPVYAAEWHLTPLMLTAVFAIYVAGLLVTMLVAGRLSDHVGRKPVLFAGGLLPITFTLMAETIPAAHRGWLLVALGGVGTSAGYLLAAGAAAVLEPMFSWRVLWLLGLPTGAAIIFLNRFIPESPRFLSNAGLQDQARAVLRKFAGDALSDRAIEADDTRHPGAPEIDDPHAVRGLRALLHGRHARISWGLLVCGLAWGLANFGFVLWLYSTLCMNLALGYFPPSSALEWTIIAFAGWALYRTGLKSELVSAETAINSLNQDSQEYWIYRI